MNLKLAQNSQRKLFYNHCCFTKKCWRLLFPGPVHLSPVIGLYIIYILYHIYVKYICYILYIIYIFCHFCSHQGALSLYDLFNLRPWQLALKVTIIIAIIVTTITIAIIVTTVIISSIVTTKRMLLSIIFIFPT